MKRISKALAFILTLVIMTTALVGCSTDELSVYNAMIKAQSIKSMEAATDISLKIDIQGLPQEEAAQAQMLVKMLDNMKLTLNQKAIQDLNKGVSKAEVAGVIDAGGMAMDFGVWVDADLSAEKPVIKEIFKLPLIALMALPAEIGGKEYIVLDAGKMMENETSANTPDLSKIMGMSRLLQDKTISFLNSYAKKFNAGVNLVKAAGTSVANGKNLSNYQLKLDDATIKALTKYIVGDFIKNKDTQTLVKDFILSSAKSMEAIEPAGSNTAADIEKYFSKMEASLPEFEAKFNEFMEAVKDVKLFGEKGITINYSINDQGYIVNESGVIDLIIDTKSIQDALAKLDKSVPEQAAGPVVKLSIDFNTAISKINENVEIKFPELTEENSADLNELLSSYNPIPKPGVFPEDNEPGIKLYVNDTKVKFNNNPVIINGRTLAPAREVFEALGGELLWNPETQTVTSVVDDNIIIFTVGSSEALINGAAYELDEPAALIEDRAYVPVRFLAESLGGVVYWDDATSTALIIY